MRLGLCEQEGAGDGLLATIRTFDDRQCTPLALLPAAADQPLVDLLHQLGQVVWVRLHDLVELRKLGTKQQMNKSPVHGASHKLACFKKHSGQSG